MSAPYRVLPFAIALFCAVVIARSQQDNRSQWLRDPEEIRQTLDSLVSVSEGAYVHFVVGR
jgi:hypothetical protein